MNRWFTGGTALIGGRRFASTRKRALAGGAPTNLPIQSVPLSSAATASLVGNLGANPKVGSVVMVAVLNNVGNITGATVSGVALTKIKQGGLTDGVDLWGGTVVTPSTGVTINLPSSGRVDALVMEWPAGTVVDQSNTASGTSVTISSGSITPLFAGELILAIGGAFQVISAGPTGGFSNLGIVTNASFSMGVASLLQGAAAPISTTWTIPSSGWDGLIASFRLAPTTAQRTITLIN